MRSRDPRKGVPSAINVALVGALSRAVTTTTVPGPLPGRAPLRWGPQARVDALEAWSAQHDGPLSTLRVVSRAQSCGTSMAHPSELVGKAGFEPAASASRTLRANQAALLPVPGRSYYPPHASVCRPAQGGRGSRPPALATRKISRRRAAQRLRWWPSPRRRRLRRGPSRARRRPPGSSARPAGTGRLAAPPAPSPCPSPLWSLCPQSGYAPNGRPSCLPRCRPLAQVAWRARRASCRRLPSCRRCRAAPPASRCLPTAAPCRRSLRACGLPRVLGTQGQRYQARPETSARSWPAGLAVTAYERVGRTVVRERRCRFRRELGSDALRQRLAELHPPLVEAVDAPDHPLREDLVLVDGDQLAEHAGGKVWGEDGVGRPVAREAPVSDEPFRHALSPHLLWRLSERQRLGLGEEVGHQQVVVVPHPVAGPQETYEVRRYQPRALVKQLVVGVLAVGAGGPPNDRPGHRPHKAAVQGHGLAVALHFELLKVGRELGKVVVVRQHRVRASVEEIDVPNTDEPQQCR